MINNSAGEKQGTLFQKVLWDHLELWKDCAYAVVGVREQKDFYLEQHFSSDSFKWLYFVSRRKIKFRSSGTSV